jgi:hypothetical protein
VSRASAILLFALVGLVGGCGQKGDPLPPLVRVPVAPADFTAARRAATVDLQFTAPATNSDGTRPANIQRVDVYGFTGPSTVADEDVLKLGTKIASVEVKAPRNPDDVVGTDDPDTDLAPLQGSGLDQGSTVHVREDLSVVAPTSGAPADATRRQYLAVGVSTSGRHGLLSRRVAVPLSPPPPAPAKPDVAYDETGVRVSWTPVPSDGTLSPGGSLGYHVYEVVPSSSSEAKGIERRLTSTPIVDARFADPRVEWGVERCYALRSAATYEDSLTAESESSPQTCVKFTDSFAPAPPAGLISVASAGTINLTWDRNTEKDLAGYLVLRGTGPGDALAAITPKPIEETTFRDTVSSGAVYRYSVQAVDRSGNVSAPSPRVEVAAP